MNLQIMKGYVEQLSRQVPKPIQQRSIHADTVERGQADIYKARSTVNAVNTALQMVVKALTGQ